MEPERARALLDAERARVQQLLADLDSAQTDDREAERETGDSADPAQPLAEQGVDDAVALVCGTDRGPRSCSQPDDGTYGRSNPHRRPSRTTRGRPGGRAPSGGRQRPSGDR